MQNYNFPCAFATESVRIWDFRLRFFSFLQNNRRIAHINAPETSASRRRPPPSFRGTLKQRCCRSSHCRQHFHWRTFLRTESSEKDMSFQQTQASFCTFCAQSHQKKNKNHKNPLKRMGAEPLVSAFRFGHVRASS